MNEFIAIVFKSFNSFYLTIGLFLVIIALFSWWVYKRKYRWRMKLLIAFLTFIVLLFGGSFFLMNHDGRLTYIAERIIGETPEAKIDAYFQAIKQRDEAKLSELWADNPPRWTAKSKIRHQNIKSSLENLLPELHYRIVDIKWWEMCCGPHLVNKLEACYAEVWVEAWGKTNEKLSLVFEMNAMEGSCRGLIGYPMRKWRILDIWPEDEYRPMEPL